MRSFLFIGLLICMFFAFAFFLPVWLLERREKNQVPSVTSTSDWQQGDFITYRRIYPHQSCGGQMIFNGKSAVAPYSETERFYDHVCDRCGTTNQILNATWPQYKREWRAQ
jgi:hypothetical protein